MDIAIGLAVVRRQQTSIVLGGALTCAKKRLPITRSACFISCSSGHIAITVTLGHARHVQLPVVHERNILVMGLMTVA